MAANPNTEPPSLNEALYYHLALPSKLPPQEDIRTPIIERELVEKLIAAATGMEQLPNNSLRFIWDRVRFSLEASRAVNIAGRVDRGELMDQLKKLDEVGFLALHIKSQNAGILIYTSTK